MTLLVYVSEAVERVRDLLELLSLCELSFNDTIGLFDLLVSC